MPNLFKILTYCVLCICLTIPLKAQKRKPGGVKHVSEWYATSSDNDGKPLWINNISNDTIASGKSQTLRRINNHEAFLFSQANSAFQSNIVQNKLNGFSFFSVVQPIDTTTEQCIWSIECDTAANLVLTNKRMADIGNYQYMNFANVAPTLPQLMTYQQKKQDDTTLQTAYRIRMGLKPLASNIPATAFKGLIPEMIIFNQSLSLNERTRVESYLALKYGISLNQLIPTPYLSSAGDTIWDADLNAAFAGNIAGVGRDNISGINQLASSSTQTPGLLSIALSDTIADNTFWVWGDNGGLLRIADSNRAPRKLARTWKSQLTIVEQLPKSIITFNPLLLEQMKPLKSGESYWLAYNNEASFDTITTRYVKATAPNGNTGLQMFAIAPQIASAQQLWFTVMAAPDFFAKAIVTPAVCSASTNAAIYLQLVGGKTPYKVVLSSGDDSSPFLSQQTADSLIIWENVPTGNYTLLASDASGATSSQPIVVTNADFISHLHQGVYELTQGQPLTIDASMQMPSGLFYTWTKEGVTISETSDVQISSEGTYQLAVTDATGCCSVSSIEVTSTSANPIEQLELTPNPSPDGRYLLRVAMNSVADVEIQICDLNGNMLKSEHLSGNNFYRYQGSIAQSGTYIINVKSGSHNKSMKLVVK